MSTFSNWNDTRKTAEYLLDEYPKLLLHSLTTLQDIHPNTPQVKLYEIIIKGHAAFLGIPPEERTNYVKHILKLAEEFANAHSIPLCFRAVVFSLINEIFFATAHICVWDTIPEDL